MKLCPHCSQSLAEDTVRCPHCNKWFVEKRRQKSSKKAGLGSVRKFILLAGLGIIIWFVWSMPQTSIDPKELLDLEPSPETILRTIRSDLESLGVQQEAYYRDHGEYSGNIGALGFTPSAGVNVSLIATPEGWSAAGTHTDHPMDMGCTVFVGSARPPPSPVEAKAPGVVECLSEGA
jgi:hypothetical protein